MIQSTRRLSTVDTLEPRILFSADALSGLLPLLFSDDTDDNDTPVPVTERLPDAAQSSVESLVTRLLFIDERVPEYEDLANVLNSESTRIVMLGHHEDGLQIISNALAEYQGIESIQILSHGESGALQLGATHVDHSALLANQELLRGWADALTEDADLLLFGCNVASGVEGSRFVEELSRLTGADVAASIDATGGVRSGGNWQLEFHSGLIETSLDDASLSQLQWQHVLGLITVDTTVDEFDIALGTTLDELLELQASGETVSLREAIYAANQGPSEVDTIQLAAGTYTLTRGGSDDDAVSGDLDITDDIVIQGVNRDLTRIVMQVEGERVFDVFGAEASFRSVTVTGGQTSGNGAGIQGQDGAALHLVDARVTGNRADGNGGGIMGERELIIQRSDVSGNVSGQYGGGLYAGGAVELQNVSIAGNTAADHGGGLYVSGPFTVESSQISGNRSSDGNGGGFYSNDEGRIIDTDFNGNTATERGGAVYADEPLHIMDSGFHGNAAGDDGGAIHSRASLSIRDSSFENNTTDKDGGAVYVSDDLLIERSSFVQNSAPGGDGGAVYVKQGGNTLSVSYATFSSNTADGAGAIYTVSPGEIDNVTFVQNTASSQYSALNSNGRFVSVSGSIFYGNLENGQITGVTSPGVVSTGYNLYDYASGSGVATDINSTDPLLGALSGTTGRVKAYALLDGSPAINAGRVNGDASTDSQGVGLDEFPDIGASEHDSMDSVVFWSDASGTIYRSNTDFSNLQAIVENRPAVTSVAVGLEQGSLYWLEQNGTSIATASFEDPSSVSDLIGNLVNATSIAIDTESDALYVSFQGSSPRIDRYDLLSGALLQSVVSSGLYRPHHLEFNAATGRIFWTEQGTLLVWPSIRSASAVDGSDVKVHRFLFGPAGSSVSREGTDLYLGNTAQDRLVHVNLVDNSVQQHNVSPDNEPDDVSVDQTNGNVIFSSGATNRISTLDASDFSTVASYVHPFAIVELTSTPTSASSHGPSVAVNEGLVLAEGGTGVIDDTRLLSVDADTPDESLVYTLIDPPLHGMLIVNGVPNQLSFTQTQLKDPAGIVHYEHDGSESTSETLIFEVSDGLGHPALFDFVIDITAVNDAPVLTIAPTPFTMLEGGLLVLSTSHLRVVDSDSPTSEWVYRVDDQDLSLNVSVNGVEIGAGGTFTQADLLAGDVTLVHNGSENSTGSVTFTVSDGQLDSSSEALHVSIEPINDAPTLTGTARPLYVLEGGSLSIDATMLTSSDADSPPEAMVYRVVGTVAGTLLLDDYELADGDTFTQVQLTAGQLSFRHDGSETDSARITFVVSDELSTSNDVDLTINVQAVDDPLLWASLPTPLVVVEGGQVSISMDQLDAFDPDGLPSDIYYRLVLEPGTGTLEVDGITLRVTEVFGHDQLIVGQVIYRHDGSEMHSDAFSIVAFNDSGATAPQRIDVGITAVNDAPRVSLDNYTVPENLAGATVGNILSSDPDPGDTVTLSVDDARFTIQADVLKLVEGFALDHEQEPEILLNLSATDQTGAVTVLPLRISVQDQNDPPVLVAALEQSDGAGYSLPAGSFVDEDGDDLTYRATLQDERELPTWLEFDADLQAFQVVDASAVSPRLDILITADDGRGGQVSAPLTLMFLPPAVTEPEVTEPEVTEPEVTEPEVTEPEVTEPEVMEPEVMEPEVTEPEVTEPEVMEPEVMEPEVMEPEVMEPEVTEPEVMEPEVTEPEVMEPEVTEPEVSEPEVSEPEVTEPEVTEPEVTEPVLASAAPALPAIERVAIGPESTFVPTAPVAKMLNTESEKVRMAQKPDVPVEHEVLVDSVDLQSLISPLPGNWALQFGVLQKVEYHLAQATFDVSTDLDVDTLNLADLLDLPSARPVGTLETLLDAFTAQREENDNNSRVMQGIVGGSVGITTGLSAGYLLWLIRGSTLMGSVLSSLPAWRFVDPLPVLGSLVEDMDEDDESLASMVNADEEANAVAVGARSDTGSTGATGDQASEGNAQ